MSIQSAVVIKLADIIPPTITSFGIPQSSVAPGEQIDINYEIHNPNNFPIMIGVGCSVKLNGSSNWISDPSHDEYVIVGPSTSSTHFGQRHFDIPADAAVGSYDVICALWSSIGGGPSCWWDSMERAHQFEVNRQYYYLKVTNLDNDAFSHVYLDIDNYHGWDPDQFNMYLPVSGDSTVYSIELETTVGWHTVHIMWYDEDHGSWQHLSQQEYIDPGETQEYAFTLDAETKIIGVPHYEQGDYLNWSNPNESAGICVATCLGDVFGYWDTHKYPDDSSGIIYWNLVSNGPAPLIDGGTTDVNSMIRFLADEYYNAPIWDLSYAHVGNTADDFSNSRGLGAWGNTEDFYTKSQLFDFVVTEIDAGRPVGWGVNSFALAGRHYLPIMGYRLLGEDVYVNINTSSYSDEWMDWFASDDWVADTEEITRITPGGIPTDHYEPDDS